MLTLQFSIEINAPASKFGTFYGMMSLTENGQLLFAKVRMR
jgi:hypothetical protein